MAATMDTQTQDISGLVVRHLVPHLVADAPGRKKGRTTRSDMGLALSCRHLDAFTSDNTILAD